MDITLGKFERRLELVLSRRVRARMKIPAFTVRHLSAGDTPRDDVFQLKEGDAWGEIDSLYSFDFPLDIPEDWRGRTLELSLMLADREHTWLTCEGMLFVNGHPFHAIDNEHKQIILPPEMAQQSHLDCSALMWTGYTQYRRYVYQAELRLIDPDADRLATLMRMIVRMIPTYPEDSSVRVALTQAMEATLAKLDLRDTQPSEAYYATTREAYEVLRNFYDLIADRTADGQHPQPVATAIGHAHIDVAWQWRLRDTRRKAANTFATALYNMERYPEFIFLQSTPQLYQYVKEDYPELYERVKQKVREGRWEVEGGMWLEADTNITGGESLVRQFLYGQRFFQEEFGYRCRVLWLPDVFGYCATLPQIMKGSGIDYFNTIKISWSETDRFPYDTFYWESLDGTRVLTHYPTTPSYWNHFYDYNVFLEPKRIKDTWARYQQKAINNEVLISYGWGDGGGGPTPEMIDHFAVLDRSVSRDMPVLRPGKVRDFMERLEERVAGNPNVPVWQGELYLESHRGTYTSQAYIKKANRTAERDLHTAEWLATFAHQMTGLDYPSSTFDEAWKTALLQQFHDILPGSSIAAVYQDARLDYAKITAATEAITSASMEALTAAIDAPSGAVVAFNPTPWSRTDLVAVPTATARALGLPMQERADGSALVMMDGIPPLGYRALAPAAEQHPSHHQTLTVTPTFIETPFYRITLNERGEITRLVDMQVTGGREIIPAGETANVFQFFEDRPNVFDNWDINDFYEQKMYTLSTLPTIEVGDEGPLRGSLFLTWTYQNRTTIRQELVVYSHTRAIDFITYVEWHERQTLLKVAFPVAIHNDVATAEVQFGSIRRPTHRNTSWDRARFETCAQKWFDLSEGNYGVAVLNDCKYGYDVHGHTLRQTLIKSGVDPDPLADEGSHQFTYSLFPHSGGLASVYAAAYALNYPLLVASKTTSGGTLPATHSLVNCSAENAIVETVKQAEDGNGLILRFFDSANTRGPVPITLPFMVERVLETNMLEEEVGEIAVEADGRTIAPYVRPFEIKTVRVIPRR